MQFWHNFNYQIKLAQKELGLPLSSIEISETPLKQWEKIKPVRCSIFNFRQNDEEMLLELS